MRFDFSEEQTMFRDSLRSFLAKECTAEAVRALWDTETGRSPERWAKLAEMGVLGVLVPEQAGGLGMDEVDLVLLLEETGRVALPEPVVESAAVAAPLIADCESADLRERWLPALAAGDAVATVGHPINPTVADAHVADLLLLPRDGELHAVTRADVEATPQACNDRSRRLFTLAWQPSASTRIADGAEAARLLEDALDRGALATAAQQLGVAARLVDFAVEYSKERRQFGKPIGSFQALKHHLANVAVKIEFARPAVYRAAFSVARRSPTRATDVSQAKAMADEAAVFAAKIALQVHGAIGYTWEVDLHLWMKRAWALSGAWGSTLWHRRRVAAALFDEQGAAPSFGFSAR